MDRSDPHNTELVTLSYNTFFNAETIRRGAFVKFHFKNEHNGISATVIRRVREKKSLARPLRIPVRCIFLHPSEKLQGKTVKLSAHGKEP